MNIPQTEHCFKLSMNDYAQFRVLPALLSTLLGTVPRRLAEHAAQTHALEVGAMPMSMPAIQVSMIWHRHQELSPGLRWLRELIARDAH